MSQKPLVFVLMMAGLVVAWFALSPSQQPLHAQDGQTHQHVAVGNPWAEGDAFARGLAAGMDRMHRDMMAPSPTGNADVDFLATMIPHHEGAVEMARLALIHGCDPLVRQLAEEIIAGPTGRDCGNASALADPASGRQPAAGRISRARQCTWSLVFRI